MKRNIEFLNYIYQNARMGVIGINNINDKIEDEELKEVVKEQLKDYEAICDKAIELFIKYGKEEKDINLLAKIQTYIMGSMITGKNNSNNKIAKLMMEGSNKGIIEITEKLNHYSHSDEEITTLAKKLLKVEQRNLDNLKPYL